MAGPGEVAHSVRPALLPSYRDRWWIVRQAIGMRPGLAAAAFALVLLAAALPLVSIVATGLLIGAVPAAVRDGLGSPAGRGGPTGSPSSRAAGSSKRAPTTS